MSIAFRTIGVVRTDSSDLPRHWSISDVEGTLVLNDGLADGLRDIEPGQQIVVLFHFDRSPAFGPDDLRQVAGDTGMVTGVFSTCSPIRPNAIGFSILEVTGVRESTVNVRGLDMLDGTPILDIKPHVERRP